MIVCICGPDKEAVDGLSHKETISGNIVVTTTFDASRLSGTLSKSRLRRINIQQKKLNLEKIDLANKVIVVKPTDFWYQGFEYINYAIEHDKEVVVW